MDNWCYNPTYKGFCNSIGAHLVSWEPKVPPPKATPPRNKALIRPY